jgi:hypothetical protein
MGGRIFVLVVIETHEIVEGYPKGTGDTPQNTRHGIMAPARFQFAQLGLADIGTPG